MTGRLSRGSLVLLVALTLSPIPLSAQAGTQQARNGKVRVYLECATRGCDSNHFRTEITFVNWVRDLRDSEVHVMITSQGTGSGQEYLLDFIGRESMDGVEDHLRLSSSNTDSADQRVQALTGVLAIGLARFAVLTGHEGPFRVGVEGAEDRSLPPGLQGDVDDPWNYWVFRLGGDVDYEAEESERSKSIGGNFNASRTTEMWEFSISGRGSLSQDDYDITEDSTIVDKRDDWSTSARASYSLADRWSLGMDGGASSSTRDNTEIRSNLGAAVEFSFFPYSEWTRRRMTLQASIAANHFIYDETTIYGMDEETVWQSSLRWSLGFRQPWGTANLRANADAYLHDPSKFYRLSAGGRLSFRITRGLEWNIDGQISKIRDQIFLSAAKLTPEEILLKRRQLPTDYSFEISTGFSFTFGSIYNNIVNNRFGGGREEMRRF